MADSAIPITSGVGTNVDTRTESTNGHHRQVMLIGDENVNDAIAPVTLAEGLRTHDVPVASGGCSPHHVVSAASTNAANIKASAGQLYGVHVFNNAAYPVHVKFHNTSGAPTPGAGVVRTVSCQAGQSRDVDLSKGLVFATGIGITITKLLADSDTTAVAAGDCVVDSEYK